MYVLFVFFHFLTSLDLSNRLGYDDASLLTPKISEIVLAVLTVCGLINELEKYKRLGLKNYL